MRISFGWILISPLAIAVACSSSPESTAPLGNDLQIQNQLTGTVSGNPLEILEVNITVNSQILDTDQMATLLPQDELGCDQIMNWEDLSGVEVQAILSITPYRGEMEFFDVSEGDILASEIQGNLPAVIQCHVSVQAPHQTLITKSSDSITISWAGTSGQFFDADGVRKR